MGLPGCPLTRLPHCYHLRVPGTPLTQLVTAGQLGSGRRRKPPGGWGPLGFSRAPWDSEHLLAPDVRPSSCARPAPGGPPSPAGSFGKSGPQGRYPRQPGPSPDFSFSKRLGEEAAQHSRRKTAREPGLGTQGRLCWQPPAPPGLKDWAVAPGPLGHTPVLLWERPCSWWHEGTVWTPRSRPQGQTQVSSEVDHYVPAPQEGAQGSLPPTMSRLRATL